VEDVRLAKAKCLTLRLNRNRDDRLIGIGPGSGGHIPLSIDVGGIGLNEKCWRSGLLFGGKLVVGRQNLIDRNCAGDAKGDAEQNYKSVAESSHRCLDYFAHDFTEYTERTESVNGQ